MATESNTELSQFQQFIVDRLQSGEQISPEEALDLWRLQNPSQSEFADNVAALREALAELDAGERGVSLEDFARQFRSQHGIADE